VSRRKNESTKRWRIYEPSLKVYLLFCYRHVTSSIQFNISCAFLPHLEGNINGYQKKKYVCKLLYMYILGWDIDFGHMEAVNLISSNKYSEKQIVGHISVLCVIFRVYSHLILKCSWVYHRDILQ